MKRILIFILAIIVCSVCISHCNAQTKIFVYNFEKIEVATNDTTTYEIQFIAPQILYNAAQLVYIIIDPDNTGTIQFALADAGTAFPVRSRFQGYEAGERIPISIKNGRMNLFYKASGAEDDSFSITN